MQSRRVLAGIKRFTPRPIWRAAVRFWPSRPRPFWDRVRLLGLPSPTPPTPAFKHRVIASYAPGIDAFVETGTYRGDTIEAVRPWFRSVWSIELSHAFAARAQQRFVGSSNVRILEGDSAVVLPTILPELDEPCLFWLDGHWCGGETALGDSETPLLAELVAVLARSHRDIILVDDARLLGTRGYPSSKVIADLVDRARPARALDIRHDIARIVPVGDPS